MSGGATVTHAIEVTVEWRNEDHSVLLTSRNWRKVLTGKPFSIRSRGYSACVGPQWEYWYFHVDGRDTLRVEYGSGIDAGVGFDGAIADAEMRKVAPARA